MTSVEARNYKISFPSSVIIIIIPTGPQPHAKSVLHTVRCIAFYFNFQCRLFFQDHPIVV